MSFRLTADVPPEHRYHHYESFEEYHEETGHDYPPSINCKFLRNTDQLPEHVHRALYQDHSAAQTGLLATTLSAFLSKHAFQGTPQIDGDDYDRWRNAIDWLWYWAAEDIGINGAP